jgi:hypothetical protein
MSSLKFISIFNNTLNFLEFCINIWIKEDNCENLHYATNINGSERGNIYGATSKHSMA